ncbi:MAG: DUF3267 domain-containing protein [Bacteroidetes bacterium]|nr:DUF3267 domain-containing protein [Bacteroidota bacterium]
MTNTKPGQARLKPDAETLQGEIGYRKILELDFSEMIPFVFSNIRKGGVIPLFYICINAGFLFFIILYIVWSVRMGPLSAGKIFWQIVAGVLAGSIAVIPPHELLHGLAYRILGARKIRFGADFQQFIFYVTADRFPISKRELAFLAMTPFVFMNLAIISLTAVWANHITLFSASLLLSHNIMCIGDFAIISYAFSQKGELFTYDDIEKKKSYFFERK